MHFLNLTVFFIFLCSSIVFAEDKDETIILPDIEIQSSIGDRTRLTPGSTNYVGRESMDRARGLTIGETIEEACEIHGLTNKQKNRLISELSEVVNHIKN